ncbi:AbiU2 domain-containing protein [Celerinatantimonas diazotrophica]|uniref:HEPN AbiU2-like domain-containing protein n=1 Tax=Celerinatantimonas diazotrophica TaxID=412034 RepID=A0A4R1JAA1_9GAMM|nr:hypothetical protein [Celerinatantimonas diazotrophica]TCK47563.1 hypothetical protein EV690_2599 [Celerinatantimonas diazotrophica]CAG9296814.1 hypothetical protein CEDIAZO_01972 [Celerinatantimonas diazotrophica]
MRKEQLSKFKKQVNAAMIGYINLLERKELLSTSIDLHESFTNLDPQVKRSILVIQDTMYASLIVETHTWLFDKSNKSSNLSLHQLLDQLVDGNFQSKHLLEEYVKPPSTIALGGESGGWNEQYIEDRKLEFNKTFSDCVTCISELLSSGIVDRVKLLRDRLLAHKDGSYDVADNGHTVQDVFSLLSHMRAILVCLNKLFQRISYPISDSEKRARASAEKFWNQLARL